jgi:hypothetical protein
MTVFEYLSVLVSIVLALGIAHVLGGLSSIVRSWRKVETYWVHLLWGTWVLAIHVQIWWSYWDQSVVVEWTLPRFAAILGLPGLAYVLARLIMPEGRITDGIDLREHFGSVRRPFFITVALLWTYAAVWRPVAFGEPLLIPRHGVQALLAALAVVGAATADRRWQSVLVGVFLLVWLSLVGLFRIEIGAAMR